MSSLDGVTLGIVAGQAFGVRLGCGMSMRKLYPSDLTDEQWELVEPVITAWKARHPSVSGHQGKYAMREIVNAILYQNRTGCQWEFLPHDKTSRSQS